MGLQNLVQPHEAAAIAGIELGGLIPGQLRQGPPAADPPQVGVVRQNHDVIRGGVEIGLHPRQPQRLHMLDGAPRVLRNLTGSPAVRDHGTAPPGSH